MKRRAKRAPAKRAPAKPKHDEPAIPYFNMGPWPVYVGFTNDAGNFAAETKRLGVEVKFLGLHAQATTHILERSGTLCFIITIEPFSPKRTREAYAALVAHEAMHVVQEMRRTLSTDGGLGDEAEAYILQHIVQEALQIAFGSSKVRRTAP